MIKNDKGFMLAETLLVTTFVAGVLIYLFVQFMSLSKNYHDSYNYNTVEDLYALSDVVDYIKSDSNAINYIIDNIDMVDFIDISNCSLFTDKNICKKLYDLENISEIIITKNSVASRNITGYSSGFIKFINKINSIGSEPYRVVASFNNKTYATIRFGG